MLYRLPSAIYVECRDLELQARGVIAIANALRDWYFTKQSELLQYLNTGDANIRQAMLSDVFKKDTTHGSWIPKQVIADFDNIMEQFMQHDEDDDTTAEGIPHRTHETSDGYRDGMKSGDVIRSIETPFGTVTERLL